MATLVDKLIEHSLRASAGPVHIERDDSFDRTDIWRIVRDEDARRFREDYQTTARPPYIATVYKEQDARFYALIHNLSAHYRENNTSETAAENLSTDAIVSLLSMRLVHELIDESNPAAHDCYQLALQALEPVRAAIDRARKAREGE